MNRTPLDIIHVFRIVVKGAKRGTYFILERREGGRERERERERVGEREREREREEQSSKQEMRGSKN